MVFGFRGAKAALRVPGRRHNEGALRPVASTADPSKARMAEVHGAAEGACGRATIRITLFMEVHRATPSHAEFRGGAAMISSCYGGRVAQLQCTRRR